MLGSFRGNEKTGEVRRMARLNNKARAEHTYDAIVVGSGITGGYAAMELTKKGLRTLVLERGPMVRHIADSPVPRPGAWSIRAASCRPGCWMRTIRCRSARATR
jgi:choline dehydrogenase-like flavoprotein